MELVIILNQVAPKVGRTVKLSLSILLRITAATYLQIFYEIFML